MSRINLKHITAVTIVVTFFLFALIARSSDQVKTSDLIFSHRLHVVDQEIECITCHQDIQSSSTNKDGNLPSMDVCADCHDVESDDNCGQCHRDPENPIPVEENIPPINFNHKKHLSMKLECITCHYSIHDRETGNQEPVFPGKPQCMSCHDGLKAEQDCSLCHTNDINLSDIHPPDWRHQHAEIVSSRQTSCQCCHQQESYCIDCHRGDNTTGLIHDLNYRYTHGLDARGHEFDCQRCHDRKSFCNDCHEAENRMPLNHSALNWRSDHGRAARVDVENCASCHESDDPTCARAGCHSDADGIRGTDPRIHPANLNRFDVHGPWHSDDGYFCFDCHTNTDRPGVGFCGYCHGVKD